MLVEDDSNGNPLNELSYVGFLVTEVCNLKCKHCCFEPKTAKEPVSDLTTLDVLKIIDKVHKTAPGTKLVISGGEPLTRIDFPQIISYAKKKFSKEKITLQTNAVLINEQNAKIIADCVQTVDVSVDGFDEDSVCMIRGARVFSKIIRGIKILKNAGIKDISASYVVTAQNKHGQDDFEHITRELGVRSVFRVFVPAGHGKINEKELRLVGEDNLLEAGEDLPEDIAGFRKSLVAKSYCGAGLRSIAIFPNGDLYPCPAIPIPSLLIGNMLNGLSLNEQIKKVWQKGKMASLDVSQRSNCCDCDVRFFCNDCAVVNYYSCKTIEPSKEVCQEKRNYLQKVVWGV